MRLWLPYQPLCPVCGDRQANPRSLGLRFAFHTDTREVWCQLRWDHASLGFLGRVHGGLVAMVFDEAMAWACAAAARSFCTTGELRVRLKQPVPPEVDLQLRAWVQRSWGRYLRAWAELRSGEGVLLAHASADFAALPRGESNRLKSLLVFRPGDVDVLAELPEAGFDGRG